MSSTMTSGTPKVAHRTISAICLARPSSLPSDVPSNLRKDPKVKMKIATARYGLARSDR
jgi:hypothetical protein